MSSEARDAKIESMRVAYPSLQIVSEPESASLIWEGRLQPIRFTDEFDAILDDLEHDRTVLIVPGEEHEIRHHPDCNVDHDGHWLTSQIDTPIRSFIVRVTDFNDGRLPQTKILEPAIPDDLRVHFLGDGICAFAPWKYPRDEGIVAFIDHSLLWLFKWNIFSQTEPNIWIGSEMDHDPKFLLSTIKPWEACYCGSIKTYENCHRVVNGTELYGDEWIFFDAWLSYHSSRPNRFDRIVHRLLHRVYARPKVKTNHA